MSARGGTRWTAEDAARVNQRLRQAIDAPFGPVSGAVPSRRKYKNRTTIYQGQQFDSERECEAWKNFELHRIAGAIRAVISQVSLRLPGTRRRIRIDFMVVELNGDIKWFDAKGFSTETFKLKQQTVLDAYGLKIELI